MQYGSRKIAGEKEVGAAAHDQYGLGEGGPVQGEQFLFGLNLYIKCAGHLHSESVPRTEVV
jgi:hypothetical protein